MAPHAQPDIDLSGPAAKPTLSLAEILDVPPELLEELDSGWVTLEPLPSPGGGGDQPQLRA